LTERTCSIADCNGGVKARGWCSSHYERWRTTGSPDVPQCEGDGLPGEEWRPVVGYELYYQVSNLGRVRSLDRIVVPKDGRVRRKYGKILSLGLTDTGRLTVALSVSNMARSWHVPNLVLAAFVGPCPPGMECCHNNGIATDNQLTNLRWDTHSANMFDKQSHGTDHMRNRTVCPFEHKLVEPNLVLNVLNKTGRRTCLACTLARQRVVKARKRGIELDLKVAADECYSRVMSGTQSRSARYDMTRCRKGLHDITIPGGIYTYGNGKRTCAECRSVRQVQKLARRRAVRLAARVETRPSADRGIPLGA